ncbi:MAG TPA: hypothetical protein PK605_08800 [Ignavibacteria bacterium]|nr:hypothetical protein [Bacteroidota bacterium]HRE11525.1 hypothetical protein [Ignavibacteria bacterium]HRF66630.1 hypothetical protein [Ignavibacteria bacterium]HRJ04484.1 hypothetical protein [Ignavibacteria bacterium]
MGDTVGYLGSIGNGGGIVDDFIDNNNVENKTGILRPLNLLKHPFDIPDHTSIIDENYTGDNG